MLTFSALLLIVALAALIPVLVFKPRASRTSIPEVHISDLWTWRGTVGRGTYAFIGVVGFAIKHNIDRLVATSVFNRPFTVFNYWVPDRDPELLTTLFAISLPFIWVGVILTLRRLRSAQLPLWLVFLFFIPVLNLVFFGLLCLIPDRHGRPEPAGSSGVFSSIIPRDKFGSAAFAACITALTGVGAAYIGVQSLGTYGWGVFVALPFCLGLGSVLLHAYQEPRSLGSCVAVALIAVVLVAMALFAFAIEGFICIVMAVPIAIPLASLGGIVGYLIQRQRSTSAEAPSMMLLLLVMPLSLMGAEAFSPPEPPRTAVTTTIRIEAPRATVWKHLVAFSEIPAPSDILFELGVSYPIRATIDGEGVGARRECLFSTGTFVERITGWDPGIRLGFSVESGPEAMREFSPYNIHPRHLEGYLVPEAADFRLISNADGSTTLEGVSWYRHAMWPGNYWQIWSNMILHKVHRRVFEHIKTLSELSK